MSTRLITVAELLEAPTSVDWATLAENAGAGSAAQAIEQGNLIDRVSGWAANYCGQPLGLHATQLTETGRTRRSGYPGMKTWVDRDGFLNFRTTTLPVLSVVSSQWAYLGVPLTYTAVPATNWVILGSYPQVRHLIEASMDWTPNRQIPTLVQVVYVSGWPNAVLGANVTSGASKTLQVDTTLGMSATAGDPGNQLTIYDGATTEIVTVSSVTDATHVVVANLVSNHNASVGVSAVPSDMKQAVILGCAHWARERGVDALEMPTAASVLPKGMGSGWDDAKALLQPYRTT